MFETGNLIDDLLRINAFVAIFFIIVIAYLLRDKS